MPSETSLTSLQILAGYSEFVENRKLITIFKRYVLLKSHTQQNNTIEWPVDNGTGDTKKKTKSPSRNSFCFVRESDL